MFGPIFYIAILMGLCCGSIINLINTVVTKRPVYTGKLYINPLAIALGIQGLTGAVGLLRRPPSVPDVFTPATREAIRSRQRVQETLQEQSNILNSNLRAVGATGSGGSAQRERLARAAGSTLSNIDASLADIVTNAANQQRSLEFQNASQRFNSSQQALSNIGDAATSVLTLSNLQGSVPNELDLDTSTPGLNFSPSGPTPTTGVNPLDINLQSRSVPSLSPRVDPITGKIVFGG